jgi:hypothetical protein
VHWKTENTLDADLDSLMRAALDADTLTEVPAYMPLVASARRVERTELADGRLRVVDRYEPAFDPPPFARGLTRDMLGWDLCLTWDLPARVADFVIEPHVRPEWRRYADVHGVYRFESRPDGRSARVIEGVLDIRVAIIGSVAERFAVRELRAQFDGEARLLAARARRQAAG